MSFGRPDLGMEFQSAQHQYRHGTLERLRDFDLTDWAKRAGIGLAEGDTFTGREAQLMDPTVVSSLIGTAMDVAEYEAGLAAGIFGDWVESEAGAESDERRVRGALTPDQWASAPEQVRQSIVRQRARADHGEARREMTLRPGAEVLPPASAPTERELRNREQLDKMISQLGGREKKPRRPGIHFN